MTLATQAFDAAEFLDSPDMVSDYLEAALADGNPALFAAHWATSPRRAE
ncbi:hypothetical protein [uncultured Hoeflea sp.]|tara:strand:- start:301 stop:447 length:147 start_codon:yes stop_codon:yes gene_type:complete